jgi:Phytanoyl-CoA dioxygenase (PhyH)
MPRLENHQSQTADRLADDGFEIISGILSQSECDALANELTGRQEQSNASASSKLGGLRNILWDVSSVAALASSTEIEGLLESRIRRRAFPVRALFFDKTPKTNWFVGWHQDLSVAVADRIETAGYAAWSVKEGVVHVQPPRKILESMVTLRLHLDDCTADQGALRVVPGSHLFGKVGNVSKNECDLNAFVCEASKGDGLLMRPLLLHSSSPAKNPTHRRVLHIEYATTELDNRLKWFTW